MAQSVEHVIGNDEVISSILISSSSPFSFENGFFYIFLRSVKVRSIFFDIQGEDLKNIIRKGETNKCPIK